MTFIHSLMAMLNEMSPYILLGFLIAGVIYAFVPQTTMSRHLAGTGWKSVVKAAAFGIPLPLCSCGVLPTAIGLRRSGASRASATSFLIATPQTGVDSIAATWSLLGPAFAIVRPVAALVTAFFGGIIVGRKEKRMPESEPEACAAVTEAADTRSFWRKCLDALRYGFVDLAGSIGGWLVAGLIIAALITVYVPDDFFAALGDRPLIAMIAVLIVAVPMYICATGSIPIALSLMLKGLSPGTALVMLMAGPAANFASFALISREMGRATASLYLAAISAGAICFGLLVDYLLPESLFSVSAANFSADHCIEGLSVFDTICSAVLVLILLIGFIRHRHHHHINSDAMKKKYTVKGMNCPHCQAAVTRAIRGVEGVSDVSVSLSTGIAEVAGNASDKAVAAAVRAAGFDIE